ncbi:hypothetical protein B7494_g2274 [Chlorociboria aeruginascens]|nr:hypothetical protein B7494_g2274 [Chlorociboria aeruginascens]
MAEPVGEDGWLALVDEASRNASDLEQRVRVVELYKGAIHAEPWSNKLWLAYCEWVWSLYTDCQTADAGWPEEEQLLGQELFSLETALDVWQQGARATQYRLNDSHELWNRWISIELEHLSKYPGQAGIQRVRTLFLDRLQIPHATWDETSQILSTFITKYDEAAWESTMVQTTQLGKNAKDLYSRREEHETQLLQAAETGDPKIQKAIMKDYLEWEVLQSRKKPKKGTPGSPLILCVALYERALTSTGLGSDPSTWEDYIVFLATTYAENPTAQIPSILSVVQRATKHCPWSGALWARYILSAESENLPFSEIENIKHSATSAGVLDRDGMNEVVEVYIAWCGYLRRRTVIEGATDEDIDIADVGLPSALESVQDWGQRLFHDYKGDPLFRIERILIQYLTQKGSIREARGYWRKLAETHADSHQFWQQYYLWEMTVRAPNAPPSLATEVLDKAVHRKGLDWPEKVLEIYLRHCTIYEDAQMLLKAKDTVHKLTKGVSKRRQKEAADAAAAYAQQKPQIIVEDTTVGESPSTAKRKRESASENIEGSASKKIKNEIEGPDAEILRQQYLKRDRENTTVVVSNLPPDVSQTKIRQWFKEYGHINNIILKIEADKLSTTALVEFRSNEDVQSAFIRDGKYFGDRQIRVEAGTGLTLYVTNYPPTADENYMHDLFKDCGEIFSIRWPSLKYNTTRRFCYISFRTADAAAAATKLDGKMLEGRYKLVALYSNPVAKKDREGATAEGREVHVTGLDFSLTEDDLRDVFSKYGDIEKINLLKKINGASKGAGFVTFEKKEQATEALALDKTKLKARIVTVELASTKNFKATATTGSKASSASPALDGDSVMSASPAPDSHATSLEISRRTITLMNIPDTVNDSRVRAIAEPYGSIVKLVLRPDHQGAIVEYADAACAGRASMGLQNYGIVPGRRLRTGDLKDLFHQKKEIKTDRIQAGSSKKAPAQFIQPVAPIRRPGPGPRSGLGIKRGLGYAGKPAASTSASGTNGGDSNGTENKQPKSNADFKALFISGGQQ